MLEQPQLEQPQLLAPQRELESQCLLHLAVLLQLPVFVPRLQNQVLLGCSTGLQLVLRQLEQLEQQQVFVQLNLQERALGQRQQLGHLQLCCSEPSLALQVCMPHLVQALKKVQVPWKGCAQNVLGACRA